MKILICLFLGSLSLWATETRCFKISNSDGSTSTLTIRQLNEQRHLIHRDGRSLGVWNLVQRARCIDCNQDVFQLENLEAQRQISFDGTLQLEDKYSEKGTVVLVGSTSERIRVESDYRRAPCK